MGQRRVMTVLLVVAMLALGACNSASSGEPTAEGLRDRAITVGSFDFAESEVLAEVYSQAMEARGYRVHRAFGLGPREFVAPAMQAGLVEFLPEYAGTALQFATIGASVPDAHVAETHEALTRALESRDVTVLAAAPAQDSNAFVVHRELAQRYDLHRISDLLGVSSRLTFGGPPECERRALCLAGLEATYGLTFEEFVPLDAGGPLTRAALVDKAVDVGLLFTTDPALEGDDLVVLTDDRALQPAENVTPLVRTRVLEQHGPDLAEAIDAVSRRLTTEALRNLNAQVARADADVAAIAARWLDAEDLT